MNKIVQFLEARLAEDEKAAQSAAGLCGCHPPAPSWYYGDEATEGRIVVLDDPHPHPQRPLPRPALNRRWHRTYRDLFAAEHITRWDPERVLKDVEAKRRILDAYVKEARVMERGHRSGWTEGGQAVRETFLRLFAAVYAGHPDYDESWRP